MISGTEESEVLTGNICGRRQSSEGQSSSISALHIVELLKSQGFELLEILKSQGYVRTAVSPEISKKIPEICPKLVLKKGQKIHVFFLELEPYLPDSLVQQAEENEDLLQKNGVELAVLVPFVSDYELVFPKQEDIEKTILRKGLGLYILQGKQVKCICGHDATGKIPKIAQKKLDELKKRINMENKHVPYALCQAIISETRNLVYARRLKDFAKSYERSKIPGLFSNEYELVWDLMQKVVKVGYERVLAEILNSLEFLRWIEELLRHTGTRDHLIHSFQVFLLGTLIIDANFVNFRTWFERSHKGSSLEAAWLLASFLHDVGIPVEKRGWINSAYTFIPQPPREADFFCKELGRYYRNYSKKASDGVALRSILEKHSRVRIKSHAGTIEPDHGVVSALTLMKSANTSNASALIRDRECPDFEWEHMILPAAFAMAIHSREILKEMNMYRLLPLDIETFPIASLLVVCDHLEGFGRPGRSDDPYGEKSILFNVGITKRMVSPKIWFERESEAILSKWELNEIVQKCITSKEIRFELQPFV